MVRYTFRDGPAFAPCFADRAHFAPIALDRQAKIFQVTLNIFEASFPASRGAERHMTESALLERTRQLLKARPSELSYEEIANSTKLKRSWIEAFAANRIPDPGVKRVETLYVFLSKTPLQFGNDHV